MLGVAPLFNLRLNNGRHCHAHLESDIDSKVQNISWAVHRRINNTLAPVDVWHTSNIHVHSFPSPHRNNCGHTFLHLPIFHDSGNEVPGQQIIIGPNNNNASIATAHNELSQLRSRQFKQWLYVFWRKYMQKWTQNEGSLTNCSTQEDQRPQVACAEYSHHGSCSSLYSFKRYLKSHLIAQLIACNNWITCVFQFLGNRV